MRFNPSLLAGLLVCILTVLLFIPSLSGQMVWEDRLNLLESNGWHEVKSWQWWWQSRVAGDYKPLVWAGYAWDYIFWQKNPVGYHLGNILFHGLNSLLVYLLIRSLLGVNSLPAALGAVFWAIHPLRVESVSWITERKDVQFCFFYLLALICYLRFLSGRFRIWYGATFILALLSGLSKAMAVSLPLVLLGLDYFTGRWNKEKKKTIILEKIPFLLISLGIGVVAFLLQKSRGALAGLDSLDLFQRIVLMGHTAVFYLFKTIWPFGLEPIYEITPDSGDFVLVGVASWTILVGLFIYLLRRSDRSTWLGSSWYLVTWLPISGIMCTGLTSVADRFSYLPAIGLSLIFARFIAYLKPRFTLFLIGLVLVGLAGLTLNQQFRWTNNLSLWGPLGDKSQPVPLYNLANEMERCGNDPEAIMLYRKAIQFDSGYYSAHYNLAHLLVGVGELDLARRHYLEAIRIRPESAEARINLGNLLFDLDLRQEACQEFQVAVNLDPARQDARMNLANTLASLDRFEEALAQYRIILDADEDNAPAWFNLGYTLEVMGDTEKARACYQRSLELDPDHEFARRNLIRLDAR